MVAALTQLADGLRDMAPVFFVVGVLAAANVRRLRLQARRAAGWPVCAGAIVESEVTSRKKRALYTGRGTPSKQRYYNAKISYTYEVGHTRYQGHRIRFGVRAWQLDRGGVERLIAPYPVGRAVDVKYDPQRPEASVLDLTPMPVARQAFVLSVVCFALTACGGLLWLLR